MFDGFVIMMYSMVLTALLPDFGISKTTGGILGSITLAASALGGLLFGKLADRRGRRTGVIASVLTYSVFTAACAFAQTVWELGVFRFLLGLGMGGAWTCGAVLVSESWPDRHRGKAVGIMQSAWSIGYAAAAIVTAIVLPRFGWRGVFLVGILPALCTIWIRSSVDEPEIWRE